MLRPNSRQTRFAFILAAASVFFAPQIVFGQEGPENTRVGAQPTKHYRYRLDVEPRPQAGFSEVSIGSIEESPIEYREWDEITTVRKLNGLNKYSNITLRSSALPKRAKKIKGAKRAKRGNHAKRSRH